MASVFQGILVTAVMVLCTTALPAQKKKELTPAEIAKATEALVARIENTKPGGTTKLKDHPREAALFQHKLRSSPGPEGKNSYDAIPLAIQRIRQMRLDTAVRSELHPAVMAVLAGRGFQPAYVGGIPVGPLPAGVRRRPEPIGSVHPMPQAQMDALIAAFAADYRPGSPSIRLAAAQYAADQALVAEVARLREKTRSHGGGRDA